MAPQIVIHNNPRTFPVPSRHGKEDIPSRLSHQRCAHHPGPSPTKVLEHFREINTTTSASNPDFPGRMIGINLCFPNQSNKKSDRYHKRGSGEIMIFLSSIYHPVEHDEHKRFNEGMAIFYNAIPRNAKLLFSKDGNSNVGIRFNMFQYVLGKQGLDNPNVKGRDLLLLLKSNKFKVLLTYFKHSNYNTWRSFKYNRSLHMVYNLI